jgi:hypothetical protein
MNNVIAADDKLTSKVKFELEGRDEDDDHDLL